MAKIKEIFTSIQGEGPLVGYKQLFIRFCKCNINCSYCDTDFDINTAKDYTSDEILEIINSNIDCHSVSFTGGEPLLEVDFLEAICKKSELPIYLETNGILFDKLKHVIDDVDYVSADIKLPSCTKLQPYWSEHDKFFNIASKKNLFTKVVFNKDITEDEIIQVSSLCEKYDIELILQPMMIGNDFSVTNMQLEYIMNKFLQYYPKTRLIPQVHKFLNVI